MTNNISTKNTISTSRSPGLGQCIANGAAGGIMAGAIFGLMMNMLGMIGTIALLVESKSLIVGWLVHISISALIGAAFGVIVQDKLKSWISGISYGLAYGIFWWVLGALILMPAKLGMPVFQFNTMAWQSLMGHMVYGAVLGALVVAIPRWMHN